jgi:hypothetical protein
MFFLKNKRSEESNEGLSLDNFLLSENKKRRKTEISVEKRSKSLGFSVEKVLSKMSISSFSKEEGELENEVSKGIIDEGEYNKESEISFENFEQSIEILKKNQSNKKKDKEEDILDDLPSNSTINLGKKGKIKTKELTRNKKNQADERDYNKERNKR